MYLILQLRARNRNTPNPLISSGSSTTSRPTHQYHTRRSTLAEFPTDDGDDLEAETTKGRQSREKQDGRAGYAFVAKKEQDKWKEKGNDYDYYYDTVMQHRVCRCYLRLAIVLLASPQYGLGNCVG
jgi:hypothetical protein